MTTNRPDVERYGSAASNRTSITVAPAAGTGVVLDFYLVPLLPLLALCLALVLHETLTRIQRRRPARFASGVAAGLTICALLGSAWLLVVAYSRSDRGLWTKDPIGGQVEAVKWVERHLSPSNRMLIDDYMWNDLHSPEAGAPVFRNAQYYWTVGEDPQVRREAFYDDWRKVDYVVSTPQMIADTRQQGLPVVAPALAHSVPVAAFDTGGWRVEVRHVDPRIHGQSGPVHANRQPLPGCMRYT